jgi:thioesterase domain-containing protein
LVHYEPQKYKGKITLIMTADQRSQEQRIPIKSWGPLAGGGLTIDVLPGDHYTLLRHPNVRAAAAKLEAFLDMSQDAAHSKRLAPQTAQTTSAA